MRVVNVPGTATVGVRSTVLGWRLLSEVLDYGRRRGADIVWADARAEAVPFYEACGAYVVGEPYVDEVTGRIDRRVVISTSRPGRQPKRRP